MCLRTHANMLCVDSSTSQLSEVSVCEARQNNFNECRLSFDACIFKQQKKNQWSASLFLYVLCLLTQFALLYALSLKR